MLASAGSDATLRLWDPRSGQLLRTLLGHQGTVRSCAFSADGTMLASAGSDATLRLWDPRSGQALRTLHGHQGTVRSCAFSADGTMLASAGDDGTLRLWDPRSGQALRTLQDHKGYVMSCAFSTDGTMLASTGEDGTLRLWAPRSGQALRVTAISPTGHATWSPTDGRVIEADGDAWRWLAWLTHDAEGRPTRLPLEYFGAVPQPQRLQRPQQGSAPAQ